MFSIIEKREIFEQSFFIKQVLRKNMLSNVAAALHLKYSKNNYEGIHFRIAACIL